jgi:hypothetical protein
MNLTATRPSFARPISAPRVRSGTIYALIIVLAMISFEVFNFSTTAFSLRDLLGNLSFAGVPWSTFLALAFCGIDFAGIARLITPENRRNDQQKETWYLFGAWLIAATANAALTWWGVAVAISSHTLESSSVISLTTLTHVVPVFVAILVWVMRILIIASLSSALERLFARNKSHDSDASAFRAAKSSPVGSKASAASPLTLTRMSGPSRATRAANSYFEFTPRESPSQNEAIDRSSSSF